MSNRYQQPQEPHPDMYRSILDEPSVTPERDVRFLETLAASAEQLLPTVYDLAHTPLYKRTADRMREVGRQLSEFGQLVLIATACAEELDIQTGGREKGSDNAPQLSRDTISAWFGGTVDGDAKQDAPRASTSESTTEAVLGYALDHPEGFTTAELFAHLRQNEVPLPSGDLVTYFRDDIMPAVEYRYPAVWSATTKPSNNKYFLGLSFRHYNSAVAQISEIATD